LYISSLQVCKAVKHILLLFVETPRKFITAKLSIRKPGSSSVLIICDLFISHALLYTKVLWSVGSHHLKFIYLIRAQNTTQKSISIVFCVSTIHHDLSPSKYREQKQSPPWMCAILSISRGDCFRLWNLLSDEWWRIALTQKPMEMDFCIEFCDPGLRIESFAVINLRGVSTNNSIIWLVYNCVVFSGLWSTLGRKYVLFCVTTSEHDFFLWCIKCLKLHFNNCSIVSMKMSKYSHWCIKYNLYQNCCWNCHKTNFFRQTRKK
jgi:hypothetical protein